MSTRSSAKMPHQSTRSSMERKVTNRKRKAETALAVTFPYELTYDILSMIFKNLNIRDLGNAARVCRFWSEVAEIEKRIRARSGLTSLCDLKESWNDMHPGKEFIDHLRFKPMLHLVFVGSYDYTHPLQHNRSKCPCQTLPTSCNNLIIGNYGIVKDQIELEDVEHKAACLLLPEEPGVTIKTICGVIPSFCGLAKRRTDDQTLKKMALAENNVKCFIILTNSDSRIRAPKHNIVDLLPRDNRSVAGGIVNCLKICRGEGCRQMCCDDLVWAAILISGPSVESWSVVMRKNCNTKEKVEAKLKLLKDKVKLKKHSVAFMFACQGRGVSMFKEKNVESTIFKKLFPDVPLIGSFGGGEFGHCQVEPMGKRILQYSTVFMIVTYGKL